MIEITSLTNDLVKETVKLQQKKYREETGLFLLEGQKPVEEAVLNGVELVRVFAQEEAFLKCIPNSVEMIKTSSAVLKKISTTDSAPSVVAVGKQKKITSDWLKDAKKIVLFEGIKDAGNLGTILRTASAFGIDGILLYGETVDIYNPKCVRASVGNLWKNNLLKVQSLQELKSLLLGFEKIGTLPKCEKSTYLADFTFPEKLCMFFGSEAEGLSEELKTFVDSNVTIEMKNSVESLNLGVSASIIMYEMRS